MHWIWHVRGVLGLWWHFRKDAWSYGCLGCREPISELEAPVFKRPEESVLVLNQDCSPSTSGTPLRIVYRRS